MLRRISLILAICAALSLSIAHAQTEGVQQELIVLGHVEFAEEVGGPADLYIGRITLAPGSRYGTWHTHPGPVWIVVESGELTVYGGDRCATTYAAGAAYLSEAGEPYDLWNSSAGSTALVFSGVIPAGQTATVQTPAPAGNCQM